MGYQRNLDLTSIDFYCFVCLFFFFRGGRNSWGGFEDDYKDDVRVMQ